MSSTSRELATRPETCPLLGRRSALAAAAATAALFALAHPPVAFWPVAPLCTAPLLAALAGRRVAARCALGALAGALAAWAAAIGPAATGTAAFFGRPAWQGWLLAGTVGQIFGVAGFGAFAALAGDPLRARLPVAVLRAGAALAVAEWLRAELFGGLPWLLLAYALAPAPALLQMASLGGVTLVSAWLGGVAAAAVRGAVGPRRRAAGALLAALLAAAGAGGLLLPTARDPGAELRAGEVAPAEAARAPGTARIALVQPALPMAVWSDPTRARETVARLTALSRAIPRAPVDVVIWPENAVQAALPANAKLVRHALDALSGRARFLLLGAPRYEPAAPDRRFNAALLYGAGPEPLAVHDKVRLLPLFESAPGWLAGVDLGSAGLSAGARPVTLPAGSLRLGPLICYEVLFPELARTQVHAGAHVLVNLSNDAWFAGSAGAEQHFAAAVLLAASLRRPVLRATPTGVTGAIDAWGRVVARLPADTPGDLVVDVAPGAGLSPAARAGDAPAWIALALCAGLALWPGARGVR
jgi:apolipoprotein N-acyltransferase